MMSEREDSSVFPRLVNSIATMDQEVQNFVFENEWEEGLLRGSRKKTADCVNSPERAPKTAAPQKQFQQVSTGASQNDDTNLNGRCIEMLQIRQAKVAGRQEIEMGELESPGGETVRSSSTESGGGSDTASTPESALSDDDDVPSSKRLENGLPDGTSQEREVGCLDVAHTAPHNVGQDADECWTPQPQRDAGIHRKADDVPAAGEKRNAMVDSGIVCEPLRTSMGKTTSTVAVNAAKSYLERLLDPSPQKCDLDKSVENSGRPVFRRLYPLSDAKFVLNRSGLEAENSSTDRCKFTGLPRKNIAFSGEFAAEGQVVESERGTRITSSGTAETQNCCVGLVEAKTVRPKALVVKGDDDEEGVAGEAQEGGVLYVSLSTGDSLCETPKAAVLRKRQVEPQRIAFRQPWQFFGYFPGGCQLKGTSGKASIDRLHERDTTRISCGGSSDDVERSYDALGEWENVYDQKGWKSLTENDDVAGCCAGRRLPSASHCSSDSSDAERAPVDRKYINNNNTAMGDEGSSTGRTGDFYVWFDGRIRASRAGNIHLPEDGGVGDVAAARHQPGNDGSPPVSFCEAPAFPDDVESVVDYGGFHHQEDFLPSSSLPSSYLCFCPQLQKMLERRRRERNATAGEQVEVERERAVDRCGRRLRGAWRRVRLAARRLYNNVIGNGGRD